MLSDTPFRGMATGQGYFNTSHYSPVAVAYDRTTLPTPWPVLAISLSVSFLTSLYGTLSSRSDTNSGRLYTYRYIGYIIVTAICSIRAITAFAAAIKALSTNNSRFQSPSALGMLMLSIIPSTIPLSERDNLRALVGSCSLLLAVIAMAMMTINNYISTNNPKLNYYAKLILVGGNCPIILSSCDQLWPYLVPGCYDDHMRSADINNAGGHNALAIASLVTGFLNMLACVVFSIVVTCTAVRLVPRIFKSREPQIDDDDQIHDGGHIGVNVICGLSVFAIVVYAAITIPLHIKQLTVPRAFCVRDSLGNATGYHPSNGGAAGNGAMWTDYFNVSTPVDRWGFLHGWWKMEKHRLEAIIPLA